MAAKTSTVSRRDIFRIAGIAGVAAAIRPTFGAASATQPSAAGQGAGYYRTQLGKAELTLLSDGLLKFNPPQAIIGANAAEGAVADVLSQAYLPTDHLNCQVNTLLIRTGNQLILIDTGCGATYGPNAGKLLGSLPSAGVKPEEITDLILTHLHGDHAEGLFSPSGQSNFPNARVTLHQAERDFWNAARPDFSQSGVPDSYRSVMATRAKQILTFLGKNVSMIDGDTARIAPGVTAIHAPGHTPGHLIVAVESESQKFIYMTDLSHNHAILFAHPEWYVAFDTVRDQGVQQRKDWYARFAAERTLISGAHLPFPAFGHVQKTGENYRWIPIDWEW